MIRADLNNLCVSIFFFCSRIGMRDTRIFRALNAPSTEQTDKHGFMEEFSKKKSVGIRRICGERSDLKNLCVNFFITWQPMGDAGHTDF